MLGNALWALTMLALAGLAATGWGWWALRLFRVEMAPVERWLVAHALGWGALAGPLLGLGLAHWLYPAAIWAVLGLGWAGMAGALYLGMPRARPAGGIFDRSRLRAGGECEERSALAGWRKENND